jgi:hypothetical protein
MSESQQEPSFMPEPDSKSSKYRPHHPPSAGALFQKKISQDIRLAKAHAMACARGGACLTDKIPSHTSSVQWKCARDHVWKNTFCMILCENFWCPNCPEDERSNVDLVLARYVELLNAKFESKMLRGPMAKTVEKQIQENILARMEKMTGT